MQTIKVKIKRIREEVALPEYKSALASGFDLAAAEDVIVKPGKTVLVPTGIAVEIPAGYELQIRPRSGISKRTKLRLPNAPGTVDADYRGEVGVLVENIMPPTQASGTVLIGVDGQLIETKDLYPVGTYLIRRGDRIAQGVIVPVVRAEFVEVDELSETERGAGGFGSTGVQG